VVITTDQARIRARYNFHTPLVFSKKLYVFAILLGFCSFFSIFESIF
jgi:hypothetical protein